MFDLKRYCRVAVAGLILFGGTAGAHAGDIVITEIMQNPNATSDTDGEWFEIFNKGSQAINLNGWTIRDVGSDSHTISGSVIIAPGTYAVLGRNGNMSTNGGVTLAYVYSGISLANADDEIILEDTTGAIVDEVHYDGGASWPDPTGASMELTTATADNNVGANWATATDAMGNGDLGTPGTGPDGGSGSGTNAGIVITEVMQNPDAASDNNGEWFELHNTSPGTVNLNGWTIRDNGSDSHTISGDVFVPSGAFVVLGRSSNTNNNGGIAVDYVYSGFTLGNGADEVVLEDASGTLIDEVAYDGGATWPDPTGASMELNDPANDNNVGANWATATNVLASGDKATPGTGPTSSTPSNTPPVVNAGANKSLVLSAGIASTTLSGSATDADGDTLTVSWSVVVGDGASVSFTAPNSAVSDVSFTATGSYTLQLSANDGTDTSVDTVAVTVSDTPTGGGSYSIYFGNTHAHTEYSDGNKAANPSYSDAANSFRYARDTGGLDWIIMSDHNHATAGMAIADYHAGVAEAATVDAESASFTPLYGMEWGTISTGGHVITVSDSLWGWEAGNYDVFTAKGDYNAVFNQANVENTFIELCHPATDHFSGLFTSAHNASWDNAISLIAVKSGPAFATVTDYSDPSASNYQSRYFDLLLLGYHLGPTGDQDTHYDNWGLANQQRTAVLATDNTRAAILEALKAGRTYATEDLNVQVSFTATVGSTSYEMAESVSVSSGTQVTFNVTITDPDGENILQIELMQGSVGGASVSTLTTSVTNTLSFSYTPSGSGEEFFLIRATEEDTQKVWTAPIWLNVQ